MKIIVAGLPKTGTTSLSAALNQLGFKVYDYFEHYHVHRDQWMKVFNEGASTEDFRSMYEDVDAVADVPPCYYWEEIYKAFPDSKVILTLRDDEESWFRSYLRQSDKWETSIVSFLRLTSQAARDFRRFTDCTDFAVFAQHKQRWLDCILRRSKILNSLNYKISYRSHNSHVIASVPSDKLLVFNVKQGWKPLCDFLGVEIPTNAFPHKNVGGSEVQDFIDHDPLFKTMKTQTMITVSLLVISFAFVMYFVFDLIS
ncbi:uncharacterized protein LOC143463088 [Clavelina lepadiformis]|uniref:Sulfotransferase family protein n=1 Tax=Clavelina lepadiformis TaxID=159417 RepID=A0ABP0FL86_CLALP